MAAKLTDAGRAKIIRYLREGKSYGEIAKGVSRSKDTVRRIADEEGINRTTEAVKKAGSFQSAYAEQRRLDLIGKGFDKAEGLLGSIQDAGELQKWTVAVGVLVDKIRLETGEATARTENVDPERRRKMKESLDELAARRRATG